MQQLFSSNPTSFLLAKGGFGTPRNYRGLLVIKPYINTSIVFPVCENPRVREISSFRCLLMVVYAPLVITGPPRNLALNKHFHRVPRVRKPTGARKQLVLRAKNHLAKGCARFSLALKRQVQAVHWRRCTKQTPLCILHVWKLLSTYFFSQNPPILSQFSVGMTFPRQVGAVQRLRSGIKKIPACAP